jgi:tRNA pseudouridine55 synthase
MEWGLLLRTRSFSALKMDGMPLYEYARKGIPLPRAIEPRTVTVHKLEIEKWLGDEHGYSWPTKELSGDEKKALGKALHKEEGKDEDSPEHSVEEVAETQATGFVLKMTVSGGTYVRSIVHDLAHAVGSAGHVVTLTRTRQGAFVLEGSSELKSELKSELESESESESDVECIPWSVFEGEGTDWEALVRARMQVVE